MLKGLMEQTAEWDPNLGKEKMSKNTCRERELFFYDYKDPSEGSKAYYHIPWKAYFSSPALVKKWYIQSSTSLSDHVLTPSNS